MAQALENLPKVNHPNLLVGFNKADDAAVYKLNEEMALIQTLDFFTPIVDDPYMFGQIAAANALSDVYAMGGKPTLAMNIVCFPTAYDMKVLGEILRGGADKVIESGAILVGGHSVEDDEPKYGLSVSGLVHPEKVKSNDAAQIGDVLILSKPLGLGILNTGIKEDLVSKESKEIAIKTMAHLNKYAAQAFDYVDVNGVTDITGFGFLGHAMEMAKGCNLSFIIDSKQIPIISGTKELAEMGIIPAGMYSNKKYVGKDVKVDQSVKEWIMDVLYDPQTSGGLLISVRKEKSQELIKYMKQFNSMEAKIVGEVVQKDETFFIKVV